MIDFEIADIKKENIELKDLNQQYFENILRLMKDTVRFKIISIFELSIIIVLLISHIPQ